MEALRNESSAGDFFEAPLFDIANSYLWKGVFIRFNTSLASVKLKEGSTCISMIGYALIDDHKFVLKRTTHLSIQSQPTWIAKRYKNVCKGGSFLLQSLTNKTNRFFLYFTDFTWCEDRRT